MEEHIKAEMWDNLQYLFRGYNDRMIHVELRYDIIIEEDKLRKALMELINENPVLHSSFIAGKWKSYWRVNPWNIEQVFQVKSVEDERIQNEIDAFLMQMISPEDLIQMKVLLLLCHGKSILCLIVNHMCMDGGALKTFMKMLCREYDGFHEKCGGTRRFDSVYCGLSGKELHKAKNLYKNINSPDQHGFPFTKEAYTDQSFISKKVLSRELYGRIKQEGRRLHATVNDIILAAYFFVFYAMGNIEEWERCSISCAIDLRRHMQGESIGLANHTAWMQCSIPYRGKTMEDTIKLVVQSSKQFKEDQFMGLHGLPLLNLCYKLLPHVAAERLVQLGYDNPLLAMSNIGILEAEKLALAGNRPTSGYMSGAVKYKPYALLTVTSMDEVITLSMCVRGNVEDRRIVEEFLDRIENVIEKLS